MSYQPEETDLHEELALTLRANELAIRAIIRKVLPDKSPTELEDEAFDEIVDHLAKPERLAIWISKSRKAGEYGGAELLKCLACECAERAEGRWRSRKKYQHANYPSLPDSQSGGSDCESKPVVRKYKKLATIHRGHVFGEEIDRIDAGGNRYEECFEALISRLSEAENRLLNLCLSSTPVSEIADLLGVTTSTVKARIRRLKKRVANLITPLDD